MDTEYLYSIIDLYLKNENDNRKTSLNIEKKDDIVEFNFNMDLNSPDKTTCKLKIDDVNLEIWKILNIFRQNVIIIDEKYDDNKNKCHYEVIFQNGRKLSLNGFNFLEINRVRNILYNITINSNELHLKNINDEKEMAYKPLSLVAQAGFLATSNVFLIVLYATDLFAIILWLFKVLTK